MLEFMRHRPSSLLFVSRDADLFRISIFVVLICLVPNVTAAHAGIRRVEGRHITLVTDLPEDMALDELPKVFDQAIPQWAAYFQVDPEKFRDWHVKAYVMRNEIRFRNEGLLPNDLPPFLHGYQRGRSLWIREQPSAYYQRHLLLHEGTHAFMKESLGGSGAPWFMEGVAELLATHRWQNGRLQLKLLPKTRDEVPYWGRIKLVRDSVASGQELSLQDVLQLDTRRFLTVPAYAWSWAAATFLDGHPDFRRTFQAIQSQATLPPDEFSAELWRRLTEKHQRLNDAWQLFVADLDYGYDIADNLILFVEPTEPLKAPTRRTVQSQLGWQSTAIELREKQTYRVRAGGKYKVVTGAETWPCGPQGVTIRYHNGLPKGMLLGAIYPAKDSNQVNPFADPLPLGRDHTFTAPRDGVLMLRINEPSGQRSDNQGELMIQIENQEPADPTD